MPTKKTTKKTPAKKSAKSTNVKHVKTSGIARHIGLQAEDQPFMTFQITRQTLYWLVLGAVVIVFTLWISQLQMDIQAIYDKIDATLALT